MADAASGSHCPNTLLEQLANEPQTARRRRLLRNHRPSWGPDLVTKLYDEMVRLAHVDLCQAERLASAAAWLSEQIEDESSTALGLRAMGHIFFLRRKYPPAWERYEAALAIYRRLGMDFEVGRTLSGALSTLIYLGRYEEALDASVTARYIFSKVGNRLRLARLDANTANILNRQARFEEALELYQRAYAAFVEIGEPQDVAITLRNLATCHINLNDFQRALETYRDARAYCERYHMPLLATEADYNVAYLYYLRGEYPRAIELYRTTRDRCRDAGDTYHEGLCDLDESEMYLELNLSDEGARLAQRALQTFRRLGMGYEVAKALTTLAVSASRIGDPRESLRLFGKAHSLFAQEHNLSWKAIIDLYQALVFYQQNDLSEAARLCERALAFFISSPLRGKSLLCQLLMARIRLASGEPAEAKRICLAALLMLDQTESPVLHYQAWFVFGSIEEALGSIESAYEAYTKAYELSESLRSHFHSEELRVAFLKDKLSVYESLVKLCLSRGSGEPHHEAAFRIMERAKSRALVDLIAVRAHQTPATPRPDRPLANRVREVREQLNWLSRSIQLLEERSVSQTDPQLEKLRRDARRCEQALLEALARLRAEDPEFANLHNAASVDVDQIRSTLAADAMLVQYYSVREILHVGLLSHRDLKVVPLGPTAELQPLLQLLRFQFSKFHFGVDYLRGIHSQLLKATNSHLQEIYNLLLAPIESELSARHLIIAPHGPLHYLPFHALYDGTRYLGERFSVSYTPSASVYYLCCANDKKAPGGALVLGIPASSSKHIVEEVEAVASVLGDAEVYVGAAASGELFRAKATRSRFVHIATHGRFRQDSPMFSSIDLADSQVSLLDLYELSLRAELVTLSGCGTALNVVVDGDELLGLVRGLLFAGARAALGTLWDVNDRSTAEFMKSFYKDVSSGRNKAEALQRAMAQVRQLYPHPFHWAPFVLVGEYR